LQQPRPFAQQAADCDDENGDEKQIYCTALARWFAATKGPRDEKRTGDIGSGDPEDRKLKMPGANRLWQICADRCRAAAGIGAIMRCRAADQRLTEEEAPHG
jgi:hypothetical protein